MIGGRQRHFGAIAVAVWLVGAGWLSAQTPPSVPAASEPAAAKPAGQKPDAEKPASNKPEPVLLGRIEFLATSAELTAEARSRIDAIVEKVPSYDSDRRRIQVLGFASGDQELVSATRRLSLERALAVRDILVARGITADRIDIRPLGTTALEKETLDRVDVILGTMTIPKTKAKEPRK